MEKIEEQLNNLSVVKVPIGMHQSVMRKINYRRVKPILLTAFILLILNFIVLAWHINMKLVDAEFSDMLADFFESFDLSFYFISTILGSFFEIVSPLIFGTLLLNLIGAIYVGKKIKTSEFGIRFETN